MTFLKRTGYTFLILQLCILIGLLLGGVLAFPLRAKAFAIWMRSAAKRSPISSPFRINWRKSRSRWNLCKCGRNECWPPAGSTSSSTTPSRISELNNPQKRVYFAPVDKIDPSILHFLPFFLAKRFSKMDLQRIL